MAAGIPMTRATVDVDGTPVRLYNVHPVSPTSGPNVARWNDEHQALLDALKEEKAPKLLVAGDFNATQHHSWYAKLIGLPLEDAHAACGKGNATTWPNGSRWLPPVRIDQVLTSPGMGCLDIHEGKGKGSDHRPVIAEIAVGR
jgi:endonuclease/exonuclease/phosphatase (EEP) superfamily protein YafD